MKANKNFLWRRKRRCVFLVKLETGRIDSTVIVTFIPSIQEENIKE